MKRRRSPSLEVARTPSPPRSVDETLLSSPSVAKSRSGRVTAGELEISDSEPERERRRQEDDRSWLLHDGWDGPESGSAPAVVECCGSGSESDWSDSAGGSDCGGEDEETVKSFKQECLQRGICFCSLFGCVSHDESEDETEGVPDERFMEIRGAYEAELMAEIRAGVGDSGEPRRRYLSGLEAARVQAEYDSAVQAELDVTVDFSSVKSKSKAGGIP